MCQIECLVREDGAVHEDLMQSAPIDCHVGMQVLACQVVAIPSVHVV